MKLTQSILLSSLFILQLSLFFSQEKKDETYFFYKLLFNLNGNNIQKNKYSYNETFKFTDTNIASQITPLGQKYNIYIEAKTQIKKVKRLKKSFNCEFEAIYFLSELQYPKGSLDLDSLIDAGVISEDSATKLEEQYPIVIFNYDDSTRYLYTFGFKKNKNKVIFFCTTKKSTLKITVKINRKEKNLLKGVNKDFQSLNLLELFENIVQFQFTEYDPLYKQTQFFPMYELLRVG